MTGATVRPPDSGDLFRARRAPESGERSEVRNWSIVQARASYSPQAASALTSHHLPASSGFSGGCIRTRLARGTFGVRQPSLFPIPVGQTYPGLFGSTLLQDQTCLQTGGVIWTELLLRYQYTTVRSYFSASFFLVFDPGSGLKPPTCGCRQSL